MAIPWLRLIDVAFGLNDVMRRARSGGAEPRSQLERTAAAARPRDTRIAGVMMSALKEVFDRDQRRHELEQQRAEEERLRLEEERQRAERTLRLELLRQTGDRETSRARTVLVLSATTLLASMLLLTRLAAAGTGIRVTLGFGWAALIGAIGIACGELGRVSRLLSVGDDRLAPERLTGGFSGLSLGLLTAGLALSALALLLA